MFGSIPIDKATFTSLTRPGRRVTRPWRGWWVRRVLSALSCLLGPGQGTRNPTTRGLSFMSWSFSHSAPIWTRKTLSIPTIWAWMNSEESCALEQKRVDSSGWNGWQRSVCGWVEGCGDRLDAGEELPALSLALGQPWNPWSQESIWPWKGEWSNGPSFS